MELTKSELEIMNVIWKSGRSLSRNDILNSAGPRSWKDSSIHILLNGLLRKEAIREDGFVRSGKTWGRLYAANIDCLSYYTETVFSTVEKDFLPVLFAALIDQEAVDQEMLDSFQQELDKKRKALS